MTSPLSDVFAGLAAVLPKGGATMAGGWTAKEQRRYASPTQLGTGKGPFVDVVDSRWEGVFESEVPLAGLALLWVPPHLTWSKSGPAAMRPAVNVSASGWAHVPCSVSFTGSFHRAYLKSVPVEMHEDPSVACIMGDPVVPFGVPHLVARSAHVTFAVLLIPGAAVRVGRNRLWRVREEFVAELPEELRQPLTRRRAGELTIG